MFWQEDDQPTEFVQSENVVDVSFKIDCKQLPLDHAWELADAIQKAAPWLQESALNGLHLIHGAPSGNGWQRPEESQDAIIHLSKRARLILRVEHAFVEQALQLTGHQLSISGFPLFIQAGKPQQLVAQSTVHCRYVQADETQPENEFLQVVASELQLLGIEVKKMMSGMTRTFCSPNGVLFTRSLMVADLTQEESVTLQHHGIGSGRKMGFGIVLPHKGIAAVNETYEDQA